MLVVLSGLPGVGKTTIARSLVVAMGAVHVRIDSIEQALRDAGVKVEGEGYRVAYAVAEDNLRVGRIVVADCVNPWPLTRNEWRSVADRAGVRALVVEIICSDIVEHRRRVESRSTDIAGHRLPTWTDVVERDYRPWNCERLVIDTALSDVEESVRRILSGTSSQTQIHEEYSMNADAARTAAQIYLQDFESEISTTVSLLRSIPASNLGYKPDPKSSTGMALCRHLVLNDLWLLDGVASGSYKPVPDASDACGLMTPTDCADHYDREMRAALQRIKDRTDEELARDVELFGVYKMPAVGYLSMALRHSIHHRGQLSSYARAMGGRVPAIYGPSADSAGA